MKLKNQCILGVTILAFAVACVYQFFGPRSQRQVMAVPDFDKVLPKAFAGWQVEDRPIADTPEMLRTVESLLRYDRAIFRVYKQGSIEIAVYLAYWQPGKVHPHNIDAHTPDVCWVANGWRMETLPPLPPAAVPLSGQTIQVPLVNHRSFTVRDATLDVLYWHIDGGRFRLSQSVDEEALSKLDYWKRRLRKEWVTITAGAGSQLFVRVSANRDLAELRETPPVKGVLTLVAEAMAGGSTYTHVEN